MEKINNAELIERINGKKDKIFKSENFQELAKMFMDEIMECFDGFEEELQTNNIHFDFINFGDVIVHRQHEQATKIIVRHRSFRIQSAEIFEDLEGEIV